MHIAVLLFFSLAYLLFLFFIGHATERRWISRKVARHPLTYALSLGVYATTWTYYGNVGFAQQYGINFLAIYLGVSLTFLLAPVLLQPIMRITQTYQLRSLADLFAFRYHSQIVGILVTLFTLGVVLPYIALQIRAVAETTSILSNGSSADINAIAFCIMVTIFTILFGARNIKMKHKHEGLVNTIAFETLFKTTVLIIIALVGVNQAFGSFGSMNQWLESHPEKLAALYQSTQTGSWNSLIIVSMAAAFLLPRQFHMIFTENIKARNLTTASWLLPLILLIMVTPIIPILWSGEIINSNTPADYYILGIATATHSEPLILLVFLGGLSAASGMIIVSTLAQSGMLLNHVLLPLFKPILKNNLYQWIRWLHWITISLIIAAGYGFYLILQQLESLVSLGLISFLAIAQFLPGLLGTLFWSRGTHSGFIAGIIAGAVVWVMLAFIPALFEANWLSFFELYTELKANNDTIDAALFWSIGVNTLVFVGVSILTKQSAEEKDIAAICHSIKLSIPSATVATETPKQLIKHLSKIMNGQAAKSEVKKALQELGMHWNESRADELLKLKQHLKNNLSGMMGPVLARMIFQNDLIQQHDIKSELADNIRLIESQLEQNTQPLNGIANELDKVRLYYKQLLDNIPLGVMAIAKSNTIVGWSSAMEKLTHIPAVQANGYPIDQIPQPWRYLLMQFSLSKENRLNKLELELEGRKRWLNLSKTEINDTQYANQGDTIILIDDITDVELLQQAKQENIELVNSLSRIQLLNQELGSTVDALRTSEERYALAIEGVKDGLWDWDLENNNIYFSDRWKDMLGIDNGDFNNSPEAWFQLVHPDDRDDLINKIEKHRQGSSENFEHEARVLHTSGNYRYMLYRGIAICNSQDKVIRMGGSQTDISMRKALENELRTLSRTDPLTNINNRRAMEDHLYIEWQRHYRYQQPLSLLVIDIDHFKQYNDTYGHQSGDQCLQIVAAIFQSTVTREVDFIARYGGEEFVAILSQTDQQGAKTIAKKIKSTLAKKQIEHHGCQRGSVSISIGCYTMTPRANSSAGELFEKADAALYQAKEQGRNRIISLAE